MRFNHTRLSERIARARRVVGSACTYRLGKGGFHPALKHPGAECDCSGFASWVLGMSRYQGDKGKPWSKFLPWIETSAMVRDARDEVPPFVGIPSPVAGCLIVYGDRMGRQGHVMICSGWSTDNEGRVTFLRGVDCSPNKDGSAIRERDVSFALRRGCVYVVLTEDILPG